jgi:FKBP-type peptidyl-prolyl cis-trans isomerase
MKILPLLIGSVLMLFGCNSCSDKKTISDAEVAQIQQGMISETKKQHEKEIKEIDKYIRKKNWPMAQTATGLRYWIYESDSGKKITADDIAFISYKISLLDDSPCYEATDAEPKRVVVGYDNVESGLHEALQLMHVGDRARVILPSHLAFGFTGDSGKIPQNASVVYDLHVVAAQ